MGWGKGAQALGFRTRGLKAGGGGGKPLEALFPPAVKGRRQKLVILLPIITTGKHSPNEFCERILSQHMESNVFTTFRFKFRVIYRRNI